MAESSAERKRSFPRLITPRSCSVAVKTPSRPVSYLTGSLRAYLLRLAAGLFPPHAGQQVRAWQRGRRSNYDRGTPRDDMAALEDGSFYDQYDGRY